MIPNLNFDNYVTAESGAKYNKAFNSFLLIALRTKVTLPRKKCNGYGAVYNKSKIFVRLIQFAFKFENFCCT